MSNPTKTNSFNSDRILLAEGVEGAYPIDYGYVQQGNKVLVTIGDRQHVQELLGESVQIVESINDLDTELVESLDESGKATKVAKVKDGIWMVEGIFQRSDTKNANRRIYPRAVWERLLAEGSAVQSKIKDGGMIGHVEHPKDGRSDLKESALVVRENKLLENGDVWGRSELLDTPGGLILQELTRKGVRWGVSSRGNGTVDAKGIVEADTYDLDTYDAVARPSTPGAYPKPVVNEDGELDEAGLDEAGLDEASAWGSAKHLAKIFDSNLKALRKSLASGDQSGALSMLGQVRNDVDKAIAGVKAGLRESDDLLNEDEPELVESITHDEALQWAATFTRLFQPVSKQVAAGAKVIELSPEVVTEIHEHLELLNGVGIINEAHYGDMDESTCESRLVLRLTGLLQEANVRVADLTSQVESLSEAGTSLSGTEIEELSEARERLAKAQRKIDKLSTSLFEAETKLRHSTVEHEALTSRLRIAEEYVAENHTQPDGLADPVVEAYEAAVSRNAKLKGHRDELLECVSVTELNERIREIGQRGKSVSLMLPTVHVNSGIVKSASLDESTTQQTPRGAALAAAALPK